jgi:hypothetical protein
VLSCKVNLRKIQEMSLGKEECKISAWARDKMFPSPDRLVFFAENIPIYFLHLGVYYRVPVGKSIPPGLENIVAAVLPVVVSVAW